MDSFENRAIFGEANLYDSVDFWLLVLLVSKDFYIIELSDWIKLSLASLNSFNKE
jgi:hypothetical protein